MPITIYPGTVKKRNLNGTYSDLVPGADTNPQLANDIAEEYDPVAGVYSVGDYCIYQSAFYKCITAISIPEAFDSTKWTDISVAEELTSQKNTLNQLALIGNATAINQNGTYTKENVTGMTANHKVANWGLFSDANLTTPISPNNPPADITIAEEAGGYVITIANYTSAFYMKPTFILPLN